MGMGECGENPCGCPSFALHSPADDGNQCQIRFDLQHIRFCQTVNLGDNVLLLLDEFFLPHKNSHGIDTGRYMLHGNILIFERLQHLPDKTDLGIHPVFFYIDTAKIFSAGNSGNRVFGFSGGRFDNPGSLILRMIGIADIDRDSPLSYRKDRILMQNRSPHVGKLPQFQIGDRFNPLRMSDDVRIRYQKTGNIRPVFIYIRMDPSGDNGAGDIRTSPGECHDAAVLLCPVKAGDNGTLHGGKQVSHQAVRLFRLKFLLIVKADDFCRIHKGKTQIGGQ